jgi:hypothetical protein
MSGVPVNGIDPITVEVLGSALSSIVEEMGEALVRASFSTNIKERRDCSTALFDRHGATLCQAEHIPMHLGSFIGIIPEILKRHPVETMRPGDVFIGNDAYAGGGTHLPDIVLGEPIFVDGRIVAWAVNTAHHADFADRGHAHIYQEGLRIPPIRLYRAGELQQDVQELILLNCQVPRERLSDLRAQMAANRLGVQRIQALCGKYGTDTVLAVGEALQDYAERKMRTGISALPDGTYRFADTYDSPELGRALDVSVGITIEGSEMRLHFDGPPQMRAGINMIYTALVVERLLRGQGGGRSDDPAEFRPGPPNHRDGPTRHRDERHTPGRRQWPHQHLSTRRRFGDRRIGAGGAGAMHLCRQWLVHDGELRRDRSTGWASLGLSRNDRWRLRCARRQRRVGWCPCAHDEHLEPAGRSARDRVSADSAAL